MERRCVRSSTIARSSLLSYLPTSHVHPYTSIFSSAFCLTGKLSHGRALRLPKLNAGSKVVGSTVGANQGVAGVSQGGSTSGNSSGKQTHATTSNGTKSRPEDNVAETSISLSARVEPEGVSPPASRTHSLHRLPSGGEVDEYEGMDDVGYHRKDVVGQQKFVETELELTSDEESDEHQYVQPTQAEQEDSASSEELSSVADGSFGEGEFAEGEAGQSEPKMRGPKDETWDEGPQDITFAEPVVTPNKDSNSGKQKEPGASLSRVESLSSSFKDFDSELRDDEGALEVEDFVPQGDVSDFDNSEIDMMKNAVYSRTSSLDVIPDFMSTKSEPEPEPQVENPVKIASATEPSGFSFPVTPPSPQEPEPRVFTSWPSVRSSTSLTSHEPGQGPDDGDEETSGTGYDTTDTEPGVNLKDLEDAIDGEELDKGVSTDGGDADEQELSKQDSLSKRLETHMINLTVDDLHEQEHHEEREAVAALQSPTSPQEKQVPEPYDSSQLVPRFSVDEQGMLMYEYDADYIDRKYEVFELKVYHRRNRTGFEETKDFPIRINDLIAGRYQVMDFLGSAAFSRAVQALDLKTGTLVCLKIIKNNKDYFDQSLDEIKLLKFVNSLDTADEHGIVRLYDYFYYKEHLFLVCELLRANLYEFQKYNKESGDEPYFTCGRIQRIAQQVLRSLAFLHSIGLIHSDLKPENILIKSYSKCEVKVIDLGSSCFITDQLSSYVQSRSYRAPEVILGLPYDHKIDVWSLGCILSELSSGYVLFQNDSLSTLLARLEGIIGSIPKWMIRQGRYSHKFYTKSGLIYERSPQSDRYEVLVPKKTCLAHRLPDADEGLLGFISYLLTVDPSKRPTAEEALMHPWLQYDYSQEAK